MRTHKRKKSSRIRGGKTCGWGFRQKHKGHGNQGGFGMAGAGKRADHKKQFAKNLDANGIYFGKQGLTSRGTARKKYDKINLSDIKGNFFTGEGCKIDLSKHKILGDGDGFKATITAKSATASAIEKMKKAGGKIILEEKKTGKQYKGKGAPEDLKDTGKVEKVKAEKAKSEKKDEIKKEKSVGEKKVAKGKVEGEKKGKKG